MNPSDTIVALATGTAASSRAIVRLSGAGVQDALRGVLSDPPSASGAFRSRLRLGGDPEVELPVLLVSFAAPRSYTGEAAAEVQFPGGSALRRRVIDRLLALPGVRAAEPGEFTARAFLNGRLTAEQAEGVGALIAASSQRELDAANRLLNGKAGDDYRRIADELAAALALVEAGLDFTDQEDVVAIRADDLAKRLIGIDVQISDIVGPASTHEAAASSVRVILVGPPNAGKSTLFNVLLGRERAIVSPQAGTTRDAIAELLPLETGWRAWNSPDVTLVDLAGLDTALSERSAVDRLAQDRAREEIAKADVIVACDPAGQWGEVEPLAPARPIIRVRTKADLPVNAGESTNPKGVLSVCALDGWNVPALRRAIGDAAAASLPQAESSFTILPRHRRALLETQALVQEALGRIDLAAATPVLDTPELIAGSLRMGLDRIGEVAGRISPDDVIGRIFATFCIGK